MERQVIYQAITGSHSYNLQTPESDVDRKAVFVAPVDEVLGLWRRITETITEHEPDFEYHELGKFLRLALKCNPSILELLYSPQDCIEKEDGVWTFLKRNADKFLSEKAVLGAYGGYAIQQMSRIEAKIRTAGKMDNHEPLDEARVRKHIRHIFRLFWQGEELLSTGALTVRLTDDQRDALFELGDLPIEEVRQRFEEEKEVFDACSGGSLPDRPDEAWANEYLVTVRRMMV